MTNADVLILGGGVAGLTLARTLAHDGLDVALLEAGDAPAAADTWTSPGASGLPRALLNPWRGRKGDAHPDDLAGLAATWALADALASEGGDPGAVRSGVLRVPTSDRQARAWRDRTAASGPLAWLDGRDVGPPLHAPFGALLVADGGWIDPPRWLGALAASARRHGATLHAGVRVDRLAPSADGGWTARAAGHDVATGRRVVVAVGADARPDVGGAGDVWPAWTRTRGDEVHLRPGAGDAVPFPRPLAGGIYAAPDHADGTGGAWVGGGHRPPDVDDPDAPANLRRAVAWSVPALGAARVASTWTGVRAKREGARPDVREVAPGVWSFGAFAGRGFLVAALEARRLADAWRALPPRS